MGRLTFKKEERLSGKKKIKNLFDTGSSFYLYPFKVIYLPQTDQYRPTQVLISVPKKKIHKAVERNTIKRRFRETYRHCKHLLFTENKWIIAYIYTAEVVLSSSLLSERLPLTFSKLKKQS